MTNNQSLRQSIRQKRNELTPHQQQQCANDLKTILCKHPKVKTAKKIAIYLANDGELESLPFIQWCWQHGIHVYLPVIHPFSKGNLLFLRYRKESVMVLNQYNILEPKLNVTELSPLSELDIIFTPLVAFDETGSRIGMGGGFYDRTLNRWYQSKIHGNDSTLSKMQPIGLAHDCQKVNTLVSESWDIPLPEIITPSQIYTFNS